MTTYYADFDLTTGSNDGTSAVDAWQSMADIISGAPGATDIVLCKGTDSISAMVAFTLSGSSSGHIKLIGVDESWSNVGGDTRAIIDAGGGSFDALSIACTYLWLENFEVKNAGSSGTNYDGIIFASGAYRENCVLKNVYSHDNYGTGFNGNGGYCRYSNLIQCRSSNNAGKGFEDFKYSHLIASRADNNVGVGFDLTQDSMLCACIAHDNGGDGFYLYSIAAVAMGCTAHGNTGAGFRSYNQQSICASRSTDNGVGFAYIGGERLSLLGCYGQGNTTAISGSYDDIGGGSTILSGSDTDFGYVDSSADDYRLDPDDASVFNEGFVIP